MTTAMDKLKAMREARQAREGGGVAKPAETVKTLPPETVTASAGAVVPASTGKDRAPWYQEGCKTCSDSRVPGIRPDESGPCAMCRMMSKKAGGPVPEDYEYDITEGSVVFIDKATGEEVATQVVAEEVVVKVPEPEQPPEEEAPSAAKAEAPAAASLPTTPAPSAGGTPIEYEEGVFNDVALVTERDKFDLLIECAVVESKAKGGGKLGSPSNVITGEELHHMVISQMSKILGTGGSVEGWYGVNVWVRRDAILMYAKQIAEMVGSSTVVVGRLTRASEMETIVSAIRPYARRVVQALQG